MGIKFTHTVDDPIENSIHAQLIKEAQYKACDWIETLPREILQGLLDTGKTKWPCTGLPGESICIAHLIREWFEFLDRCAEEKAIEDKIAADRRAACPQWGSW